MHIIVIVIDGFTIIQVSYSIDYIILIYYSDNLTHLLTIFIYYYLRTYYYKLFTTITNMFSVN